jgi:hypothetical protein
LSNQPAVLLECDTTFSGGLTEVNCSSILGGLESQGACNADGGTGSP